MKYKIIKSLLFCVVAIILTLLIIILFFNISFPLKYENEIKNYSKIYSLEQSLVASIINVESGFNEKAQSSGGAIGLMQVLPNTANYVNKKYLLNYSQIDLFDVETNIRIGCAYLHYLFDKFKDEKTVIYAYNAGEGNVSIWLNQSEYSDDGKTLKITPYDETNNYYDKVIKSKNIYKKKMN